jgi:glycosyltransferase involved in cell wall biosynthesis
VATLSVSIVIPAKNEEASIGAIVAECRPHGDEVVVVDGCSVDATARSAETNGARVIRDHGLGKGDALRVGATAAKGTILVFFDADGSHESTDIPRLLAPIRAGEADMVIASRGRGGSDELHGDIDKLLRSAGSDIILIGINYRFGARLTDCQNGFRAIRKDVFLALHTKENIHVIEQEMTMRCLRLGYRVAEVPSHENARRNGRSHINLRKVWLRYVYSWLKGLIF